MYTIDQRAAAARHHETLEGIGEGRSWSQDTTNDDTSTAVDERYLRLVITIKEAIKDIIRIINGILILF